MRSHISEAIESPAGARGFTLIELMLVMVLIAVLSAIATQYYFGYRATAFDARAMHDLGNAAIAQEAYYATNFSYVDFESTGPAVLSVPGMVVSDTVTIKGEALTPQRYTLTATSSRGSGRTFAFDSSTGAITSQ